MYKIGILTINDNNNYGNRLQNYALQETLKKLKFDCITIRNEAYLNDKKLYFLRIVKNELTKRNIKINTNPNRQKYFTEFNENINFSGKKITAFSKTNEYEFVISGSDQVWNPYFKRLRDVDLLCFVEPNKRISYAASFGIDKMPEEFKSKAKDGLSKFKAISTREEAGREIIEKLTGRGDIEVLIDPSMLLTSKEWDKVAKRPKQLENLKNEKYILNYFLGNLSEQRRKEIEKVAKKNDCEIINMLDKNNPFYETGPSEFLYLEKHAFLICTDSFHSSVFAILYNRPFVVFSREERKVENMNSRLDTLLMKFHLENKKYNGKNITKENLEHDYTEAYKILEGERKKSIDFLKNALDIDESSNKIDKKN